MIKGSEIRKADHEIEPFLLDRWSPRAMSGEEISQEELMRLFEAARWAPSSFNAQQWRALYARRGTEHWQTFFDLLVDANKAWAKNAAVLWSCSFRERILTITTNHQSRIPMIAEQRGKISHCKAFKRVSSCMGCKALITIAPAKNCGSLTTFKSKRWPPWAGRVRKNCFLRNIRRAKPRTIDGNFPRAFSKGRSNLNNSG
jgi:nitroreductase